MFDLGDTESWTKGKLQSELELHKKKLDREMKEYHFNLNEIQGFLNSIESRKNINPYANYNGFKELTLIKEIEWHNQFIIASVEEIKNRIKKLENNLKTYDKRYNKKFGRKSPFIKCYLVTDSEVMFNV